MDVMRSLSAVELSEVSGGELTCTVTVSANPSASCTGSESDWIAAGAKVYYFLAASPFTVPGIIERIK